MSLKLVIEVYAGIIPGEPIAEHTMKWIWTGEDQQKLIDGDKEAQMKWIRIAGESREYAATLENPGRFNWVRRDWVWM